MRYLPLEDYGVIGDLHTIALIGTDGSVDWCCLPSFDSPSVFGRILDQDIGGYFSISALNLIKNKQVYLPNTNILVNRHYTGTGLGQVENFMPLVTKAKDAVPYVHRLVRRLTCVRGMVTFSIKCAPAFDYARAEHRLIRTDEGVLFETDFGTLNYGLRISVDRQTDVIKENHVELTIEMKEGECVSLVFFCYPKSFPGNPFDLIGETNLLFDDTKRFWINWISSCAYVGLWSDMVHRSALVLKLLTYEPTGAIVAAPTLGLPEQIGGERNWDYRYTWIRDASFTVYALMRIGFTYEAERFMDWVTNRLEEMDLTRESPVSLMYTIHGGTVPSEEILLHLKGYRGSQPVRVGNAAANQLQLDIFGELMDAVYLFNKYGKPVSYRQWSAVRKLLAWICKHWDQKDEGIWETRGGREEFVFSRLMCWVALDRGIRMSTKDSLPGDVAKWTIQRDKIYDQIMLKGWNPERGAFRQHYKTVELDAANLLMPLVKFISPIDPRMLATVDATLLHLTTDSLVFRYDPRVSPDGLSGTEGTFSICTFWLVECLTRAGRLEEARDIFQKMLGYANHLGLYGEEIGLHGETLGNFPQALTHLGLISAAYNLNERLQK